MTYYVVVSLDINVLYWLHLTLVRTASQHIGTMTTVYMVHLAVYFGEYWKGYHFKSDNWSDK